MRLLILTSFLIPMVLTGCSERENPLLSHSSKEVAEWVYNKKTPEISRCSEVWANQDEAPDFAKKECDPVAISLAATLTEGGFGNITAQDVKLPTLWLAYQELENAANINKFDAQKAGEAMKLPDKSTLGERLKQMQREKEQRKSNN